MKFVIIAEPRTGSNYLSGKLDGVDGCVCHRELFHAVTIYNSPKLAVNYTVAERNADPEAFLNSIYINSEYEKVGFKLFFNHCPAIHVKLFNKFFDRVVLLERKDKLSQYASHKISRKTKIWSSEEAKASRASQKAGGDKKDVRVFFSFIEFLGYMLLSKYKYFKYKRDMRSKGVAFIHVYYEELVSQGGLVSVEQFLGVEFDSGIGDYFVKEDTRDVYDRFSNKGYSRFMCRFLGV